MVENRFSNVYTRHTNYSYVEEQNEERTQQLVSQVKKLKNVVIEIRNETRRQNEDLKNYDTAMNHASDLVNHTRRRVQLLFKNGSWKIYYYLIFFSLFIFLVIYLIIK
ncbi:unnamed protein product [Adineta steineri]|uniref:t-SNARE coiled-coil homology domain-containing protein n=1 Tax=Adineta steineri TaxID=433720 RepID=A0A813W9Z1_9BILA|nr:unnamed protein product [Adineta steineri]CAF3515049.1 unnamed protein product [Adineta steineri]